jgi:hypothetical protein
MKLNFNTIMAAGISAGTFTVLTLSKYKHDQNGKLAKIDS